MVRRKAPTRRERRRLEALDRSKRRERAQARRVSTPPVDTAPKGDSSSQRKRGRRRKLGWLAAAAVAGGTAVWAARKLGEGQESVRRTLPAEPRDFRWRGQRVAFYGVGSGRDLGAGDPVSSDQDSTSELDPVVLVHGLHPAASAADLRQPFQRLRTHRRVYAYDLLGFGASDRPDAEYSPRLFMELLQGFLEEVVGRPAHVVAWGLSAAYALQVASEEGGLFRSLTVVNPVGLLSQARRQKPRGQMFQALLRTPVLGEALFKLAVSKPILALSRRRRGATTEIDEQYQISHQRNARYAPAALLGDALAWNAYIALRTAQTPLLAIWSSDPELDDERRAFAGARYQLEESIISGSADQPHEADPEGFVEVLDRWFETNSADD